MPVVNEEKCWKHLKAYVIYRGKKMANKWAKSTSQNSKSTGLCLASRPPPSSSPAGDVLILS